MFAFKNDNAEPRLVAALERDVALAAGARGFAAVSSQDVASMIDIEATRQAAGCVGEVSCLAEIAGGLGATWIITGTVSQLSANQLELALVLLDRTGTGVLGRSSASGADFEHLRANVATAVARLWDPTVEDDSANTDGKSGNTDGKSGNGALRWGLFAGGGAAVAVGLVGLVGLAPLSTALTADATAATAADAYAARGRNADLQGFFDASAQRDAAAGEWNSWGAIAVAGGLTVATAGVVLIAIGAATDAE